VKWPLLMGLAALFALGAILLSRKQVVLAEGDAVEAAGEAAAPRKASAKAGGSSASAQEDRIAEVNAQVSASLDALKETIFRLELRKQAGTISEEEYARERARVEKQLRELVKG